jgi:hypothetical protein
MAHRPESKTVLSREELAEFRDCRFDGKKLPPAVALQQFDFDDSQPLVTQGSESPQHPAQNRPSIC